jgi:hypothetical protein
MVCSEIDQCHKVDGIGMKGGSRWGADCEKHHPAEKTGQVWD